MSTEVHPVEKEGQRPKYKDYVSFLEAYKNGKREESCNGDNFSQTDSSNNSSSSEKESKKSFREYLESYNSKRYGPVQPSFIRNGDAKNTAENTVGTVSKTFEKTTTTVNKSNRVNSVSKMFEKNSATDSSATKTVSSKVNQFEFQILNGVDGEAQEEQRKISIVEISKKFENNSQQKGNHVEQKVSPKKTNGITEKSKVLNNSQQKRNDVEQKVPLKKTNSITEKSKVLNNSQQKQNDVEQKVLLKKTNSITEKSKVFEESSSAVNNRKEIEVKKNIFNGASSSLTRRKEENRDDPKVENVPEKLVANGVPNYPPPPPPPQQQPPKIIFRPPSPARSVSPENLQKTSKGEEDLPPPPPPPPMQPPVAKPETTPKVPLNTCCPPPPPPPPFPPRVPNGFSSTLPRAQNGTRDRVDGIPAPSLDKNDPRVKKLVYGALRDMYGAYHDKANDYLATLPKNRVRKNNGLDSIINSIAAQGGLDKLSGRANPNVDVE